MKEEEGKKNLCSHFDFHTLYHSPWSTYRKVGNVPLPILMIHTFTWSMANGFFNDDLLQHFILFDIKWRLLCSLNVHIEFPKNIDYELRMVHLVWVYSPTLLKHMVFFSISIYGSTHHHSNIGIRLMQVTKSSMCTLWKFDIKFGFKKMNLGGLIGVYEN